jgi:hypothetical protein
MHLVLTVTTLLVALVFITVSAMMNFTFVASLGKTPLEGQMFGAVSLASDAFKALLPLLLAQAWRSGRRLSLAIGATMFVVFTGVSLLSAVGFASINRQAVARVSEAGNERVAMNRQARVNLDARIADLPAHRPISVVTEAQAGTQQDRRWFTSKNCTNATDIKSREFCATYYELRAELAAATEAEKLREQRDALQSAALAQTSTVTDADPQATVVAAVLAANKSSVQRLLVVMIALVVEIGSGFGLYIALQSWPVEKDEPPANKLEPPKPEHAGVMAPAPPPAQIPAPTAEPATPIDPAKRPERDPDIMRAILRRPRQK